jgi:hypothetical protein
MEQGRWRRMEEEIERWKETYIKRERAEGAQDITTACAGDEHSSSSSSSKVLGEES